MRRIAALVPPLLVLAGCSDAAHDCEKNGNCDEFYDGSLDNMASVFAKHWSYAQAARRQRQQAKSGHPMPTTKQQLRSPDLLENLKQMVLAAVQPTPTKQAA